MQRGLNKFALLESVCYIQAMNTPSTPYCACGAIAPYDHNLGCPHAVRPTPETVGCTICVAPTAKEIANFQAAMRYQADETIRRLVTRAMYA